MGKKKGERRNGKRGGKRRGMRERRKYFLKGRKERKR